MSNGMTKISYCEQVSLVTLSSLPCDSQAVAQVLTAFADAGINVDMISQTAPQGGFLRLSFTVSDQSLAAALTLLGQLRGQRSELMPEVLPGNAKLSFYDADMVHTPGVAAQVFTLLSMAGIQVMLITTSDVDISILINQHDLSEAIHAVSEHYHVTPKSTVF